MCTFPFLNWLSFFFLIFIPDINKFFIGGSKILLGEQIKAGIYDYEVPIEGDVSPFPYGNINHCSPDGIINPIDGIDLSLTPELEQQVNSGGGFYLEKYIRIFDKPTSPIGLQIADSIVPDFITNRPEHLYGVVNLNQFKDYLTNNIDETMDENWDFTKMNDQAISSEQRFWLSEGNF